MQNVELRKKIGQSFIIGFKGREASADVQKFILNNSIGGIILFARNIDNPIQVAELNNSLQSLVMKTAPPLFSSIDMEGGRVARFKAPFTQWPPMKILGEIDSPSLCFKFAETMGKELLAVGVNMNYAPCVDVLTNPANTVIGDRAFGTEPEIVSKMGSAIVRGFVKVGVIPAVKHFPGHGDTLLDSHEDLPVVEHDLARLDEIEFAPFKKCFRARVEFCMTAHLVLKQVDAEWPATLSHKVLNGILRERLGYRNIVMTDDMEMKAITKNFPVEVSAVQAIKAGCNILLYCHELSVQEKALEAIVKAVTDGEIPESVIEENYQKVLKAKKENFPPSFKLADVSTISQIVGHPDHLTLAKSIAKKEVPAGLTT